MAINYPISLPSSPGTRRVKWSYEFGRARARSDFTGKSQTYNWAKKLLHVGVELPPMTRADAENWLATLRALDEGSCLFGDPQGAMPRGAIANYATNLLRYSEEFDRSPWSPTNVTVTPNAATDPLGGSAADKIAATASAATAFNQLVNGAGAAGGVAFSVYVKQGSGPTDANQFRLRNQTTATDLKIGSIDYGTGIGSGDLLVQNVGSGWYRVSLVATSGVSDGDQILVYVGFRGLSETAGEYCYAWGAQLEKAASVSAYKVVGGSPVYSDIARDFLNFDGSNDYVQIPHNAAYNSNALTVEFWFKAPTAAPAATKYLATKWNGSPLFREFTFELRTDGKLYFVISKTDNSADATASSSATYIDGKWHHVAGVKVAGGNMVLYVDGEQQGSASLGQEGEQTSQQVLVGNVVAGSSANAFSGPICEFRIWNIDRSRVQIRDNLGKQLVGSETNLVGYWRFDEQSGTVLDDKTSTNNNGTVSGAAWSGLSATEMLVANLAASKPAVAELGDWLQLGSGTAQRIYACIGSYGSVAAPASNPAGVAHIEIRPGLREIPADQAAMTLQNTKGVFELEEVIVGHEVDVAQSYGIAFNLVEAF